MTFLKGLEGRRSWRKKSSLGILQGDHGRFGKERDKFLFYFKPFFI